MDKQDKNEILAAIKGVDDKLSQDIKEQGSTLIDVVEAIKGLITKKEFREFQEETEGFFMAIKNDLDGVATKEDLMNSATKEDLKNLENKIINGQDKMIKILLDNKSDLGANVLAHKRYDDLLEDHGKRIKVVESKLSVSN